MSKNRKHTIATSFGSKSGQYNDHAPIQIKAAARLASLIKNDTADNILEIGCGTGLHTKHLLKKFPDSQLTITDISHDMITQCQNILSHPANADFTQADGETICENETIASKRYDVITTSMAIQWFTHPLKAIDSWYNLLNDGGTIYYSTIGPDNFPEWQKTIDELGLSTGTLPKIDMPGIFTEDFIKIEYGSSRNFLSELKAIGAATPRNGYSPLGSGSLRNLLKVLDSKYNGAMSWHIIYGKLSADSLKNSPAR